MPQNYDFIAVGDMVTDAFIRLKEASVHCKVDRENCEICMRFADKIPYEAAYVVPAVGNSPNAAVAAARLGLKTALVSNIGDDYFGKECLETLAIEGVAAKFVKIHKGAKTNYHYVLWYEDDRTILIKHEPYEYSLPDVNTPRWLYLSSLGENSLPLHREIEEYLYAHPDVKLAFQPGTFQIKFGRKNLEGIYRRADVFFCNKEEAERILEAPAGTAMSDLLKSLQSAGPRLVVITDGVAGAYAYEGGETWFMPVYPDPKPPYERTGAGDAFSSTFAIALALGQTLEEALRWAPVNSMSVVQYVGAREGLLSREKLEEYLRKAPKGYKPKTI